MPDRLSAGVDSGETDQRESMAWQEARRSLASLETSGLGVPALAGVGALIASILLVLLTATLLAGNVARLSQSFRGVERTNAVLREAAGVREALLEAGSATRSYLLTGDTIYFAAHDQARRTMHRRLDALKVLVADNPAQTHRVAGLDGLIKARERLLDRGGGLTPARRDRLIADMRSAGSGAAYQRFSRAARVKFDEFGAAEVALLAQRQHATGDDAALSYTFVIAITLLALATGGLGIYFLLRERAVHRARELELVLTHTQRLGLMGQTSLVLAHELNQPLSAAGNYLGALKRFLASGTSYSLERARDSAERAGAQIRRAGEIVGRLRAFVTNRGTERTAQTVETLFADAVALLGTIDNRVTLEQKIAPDLPIVLVDRIQIQQVLVNLMRNAIEAMKNSPRRELLLVAEHGDGDVVLISLRDTGMGLAPDIAARLFQPFVTNKSHGMGVGLSISHRIVAAHGGRIWAEPAAGGGTLFRFTLPAMPRITAVAAE